MPYLYMSNHTSQVSFMAQTDSCSFISIADVSWKLHCTFNWLLNWQKMWSLANEHYTNSMLCWVYDSKSTKWTISDSISQATLSWKEVLLLFQHLIWMCSSISHTSLQMFVGQVDCKNLKCSKCHTILQSPSLSTSAAFLSLHSSSSVISVWEIRFQFLFCHF